MEYKRQLEFDKAYLACAVAISKLSRAKKKQVGCIIVSPDTGIVAEGFNGTLPNQSNTCEFTCSHDPEDLKEEGSRLVCSRCGGSWVPFEESAPSTLITLPEVLHAEINAILKAARSAKSTDGATLYSTLECCFNCSKCIVAAGITRVVFLESYKCSGVGTNLMRSCGLSVDQVLI